jgi:segregation and condensation protein B
MEEKKSHKKLENEIEAILFYKSEPVALGDLRRLTESTEIAVKEALSHLEFLKGRGIVLVSNAQYYSLATSPHVSATIEKVVKDELHRDLSSASLETLTIIAYKGLVSRKEIEYIRGVNSSYSLRALLLRGLIEKEVSRLDERIFLYKPTTDLLLHLGIQSIDQLPEWSSMNAEMHKHESTTHGPDAEISLDTHVDQQEEI